MHRGRHESNGCTRLGAASISLMKTHNTKMQLCNGSLTSSFFPHVSSRSPVIFAVSGVVTAPQLFASIGRVARSLVFELSALNRESSVCMLRQDTGITY